MKIGLAIDDVARAEQALSDALLEVGERHRADHDVYHLTRTLARWSQGHQAALAPFAERYGTDIDTDDVGGESGGPLRGLRGKSAGLLGGRPAARPPVCRGPPNLPPLPPRACDRRG